MIKNVILLFKHFFLLPFKTTMVLLYNEIPKYLYLFSIEELFKKKNQPSRFKGGGMLQVPKGLKSIMNLRGFIKINDNKKN
jgi:hypothetical protein